jgi:5-amino-6-(5-phospho-D-ribitylamino)uracil phosphatase
MRREEPHRLYISDLDGTLLLPDKTLGARSRAAVERFVADGGLFTIATGRSAASAARILDGLELPVDAIVHNGALTLDLRRGIASDVVPMPGEVAARVFCGAVELGLSPLAYALDGDAALLLYGGDPNEPTAGYLAALGPLHRCLRDDGSLLRRSQGLTLLVLDETPRIAALFAARCGAGSGVAASLGRSAYTMGLGVGEVQSAEASKGHAAEKLALRLGLTARSIVAFGDNANDLSLLQIAGESFCPPEATDEVRAVASGRIASVEDEGVAAYLEALLREC